MWGKSSFENGDDLAKIITSHSYPVGRMVPIEETHCDSGFFNHLE